MRLGRSFLIWTVIAVALVTQPSARAQPAGVDRRKPQSQSKPMERGGLDVEVRANDVFRISLDGCRDCVTIDVVPGTTINVDSALAFINRLTQQLQDAQSASAKTDKSLLGLRSKLWRAASKAAATRHEVYEDPATATDRMTQIEARLAYVCVALGLGKECE